MDDEFKNATPDVQSQLSMIRDFASHYSPGTNDATKTWNLARALRNSGLKLTTDTSKPSVTEQCLDYGIQEGRITER